MVIQADEERAMTVFGPRIDAYWAAYYYAMLKAGNRGKLSQFGWWYADHGAGRMTLREAWQQAPGWMTAQATR
ncbi:hypothetical protein BKG66_04990 [Mycobacteroides chelonae]|nr:hypothetical protein BKG66_04990 [Mycobacteroides chelonae]